MEIREQLIAGGTYHICTKSNGQDLLFRDAKDYFYFKRKMEERLTEAWEIVAFALIPNEVHFVIKIVKKKIDGEIVNHSTLLSHLLNGYVQHYNYKYGRSGSLLSRSFRRKSLQGDEELQDMICKVHNLPFAKKLVKHKGDWIYSSYRSIVDSKFGAKHLAILLGIFHDQLNFEQKHDDSELCLDDILPKRFWIKVLSPQEVAFRQKDPLGGHRWSRRILWPPS